MSPPLIAVIRPRKTTVGRTGPELDGRSVIRCAKQRRRRHSIATNAMPRVLARHVLAGDDNVRVPAEQLPLT